MAAAVELLEVHTVVDTEVALEAVDMLLTDLERGLMESCNTK